MTEWTERHDLPRATRHGGEIAYAGTEILEALHTAFEGSAADHLRLEHLIDRIAGARR